MHVHLFNIILLHTCNEIQCLKKTWFDILVTNTIQS